MVRWFGVLFSAGILYSFDYSITDGPGLLLIAISLALCESGHLRFARPGRPDQRDIHYLGSDDTVQRRPEESPLAADCRDWSGRCPALVPLDPLREFADRLRGCSGDGWTSKFRSASFRVDWSVARDVPLGQWDKPLLGQSECHADQLDRAGQFLPVSVALGRTTVAIRYRVRVVRIGVGICGLGGILGSFDSRAVANDFGLQSDRPPFYYLETSPLLRNERR
jgi:hypothetical protein